MVEFIYHRNRSNNLKNSSSNHSRLVELIKSFSHAQPNMKIINLKQSQAYPNHTHLLELIKSFSHAQPKIKIKINKNNNQIIILIFDFFDLYEKFLFWLHGRNIDCLFIFTMIVIVFQMNDHYIGHAKLVGR
jgi:hypothetical protein